MTRKVFLHGVGSGVLQPSPFSLSLAGLCLFAFIVCEFLELANEREVKTPSSLEGLWEGGGNYLFAIASR